MRWFFSFFVYAIPLCLVISCSKDKVSEQELIRYVNDPDNGLIQVVEKSEFTFKLMYRPVDLIALQGFTDRMEITDSIFKCARERYGQYVYFILSISKNGKDLLVSDPNLSANLNMLVFNLGNHISMMNGRMDTIRLADFHTPRYYGISGATQILLAFPKPSEMQEELMVKLKPDGEFIPPVGFILKKRDLENIPQIDLKIIKI